MTVIARECLKTIWKILKGVSKLDAHKKLEAEMAVDQMKEAYPKIAETARDFFEALKKEDFTDYQALYITSNYLVSLMKG